MLKQKKLSAFIFLLVISCHFEEKPDEITFEITVGGSANDGGQSVQQTKDGGYIISGFTESKGEGEEDVYLIKIDFRGNLIFDNTFGGSADDAGYSVQQTQDEGYIITGHTYSSGAGDRDVNLIKTVSNGNSVPLNSTTFGGPAEDEGRSVHLTNDGGYIILGSTVSGGAGRSDVYLIKTDEIGNKVFEKTFGGTAEEKGYAVQQTQDGGYIITGYTNSLGAGARDVYLVKTDINGTKEFENTFGGSANDVGLSVQETQDGGYIIAGYSNSSGEGEIDVYLIKTDANGNKEFDNYYGGAANDLGFSVQQTLDGGYVIAGYTNSTGSGGNDVYLIKTKVNGDIIFENNYGGSANDDGKSVQQTKDGGFIITGSTASRGEGGADVFIIKTNDNGDVER